MLPFLQSGQSSMAASPEKSEGLKNIVDAVLDALRQGDLMKPHNPEDLYCDCDACMSEDGEHQEFNNEEHYPDVEGRENSGPLDRKSMVEQIMRKRMMRK